MTAQELFQLTASRRGWLLCTSRYGLNHHFNSQPHEEADLLHVLHNILIFYFNSQPHEEADCEEHLLLLSDTLFQLTASRRGWPCKGCDTDKIASISTHSLTKRLTFNRASSVSLLIFQLTASRRGWRCTCTSENVINIFQLTASRRGWPILIRYQIFSFHFNSQPHEEADDLETQEILLQYIFQLTASRRGWLPP